MADILWAAIHLEILNELNETMSLDMTELHGRVVRNALYK